MKIENRGVLWAGLLCNSVAGGTGLQDVQVKHSKTTV
jgi:hypothetical protein